MSVIAGLWSFGESISAPEACREMLQALALYGPEGRTHRIGRQLAMGCRLLDLLPEDRFDRQPLSGEAGTVLVADVRLDNRSWLTGELGISGDRAAQTADSEILLHSWQRWRERCVEHLDGAFSFAVWSEREQQLFLARDHTGERPLFYSTAANCFAFASMPKGLHALSFVGAEIDEDYVARYLGLLSMPIERTIFRRIQRLPAGCSLTVSREEVKLWHYWKPEELEELRLHSDAEYLERFRGYFDQAVSARLRTTGGVGAHLSGGLDSSSVAATAAMLLAAQGRELTAFTAVPRPGFQAIPTPHHFDDEGPAAAQVAALHPNMRHVRVDSSQTPFLDILDRVNNLYDHPCFAPNNEVWSTTIMEQARRSGITVLLNGNCGNHTFSYEGLAGLSTWFRGGHWLTLGRVARELRRERSCSTRLLLRHAIWPSLPFWLRRLTDPHIRNFSLSYCILHPDIAARMDLERIARLDMNETSDDGRGMLTHLLKFADLSETAIAAQGGWRMDSRDPTLDRGVVEFCLTVPLEQFLWGGSLRSLARRSMAGRLPPETLARTQRGRQSADWHVNMGALLQRMSEEVDRLERSPLASRMLDLARMRRLVETWPSGDFTNLDVSSSYHIALTRGIATGRFLRQYDPEAS